MSHPREHGMVTAEYTVGTFAAALIATILFKLGLDHGWFFDELKTIIEQALRPGAFVEHLRHIPWHGFGWQ
jgi:hypothetical protein